MGVTTTTQAGRIKLEHPDLTHDGGSILWNKLHLMYERIGDSLSMQWKSVTLADGANIQFTHNFNKPLSTLFVRVFENWFICPSSDFTVTQVDLNTIQITNTSGVSKTFNFYVWAINFKDIFDWPSAVLKTMGYFSARYTPNMPVATLVWSSYHKTFIALANSGTQRVMLSKNGIDWELRTNNAATADLKGWRACCEGLANLSRIVAVGDSGTDQRVMYSDDGGYTWTLAYSADDLKSWVSVCWASGLSLFVAVASGGTGGRVMTSPDGITWTTQLSGDDTMTWRSVAYSPTLNLLVAVASSGTGGRSMTSPDGITWTKRVTANDTSTNSCIAWGDGKFIIVAQTGTGNYGQSSTDGINWSTFAQTAITGQAFYATSSTSDHQLIYIPELGLWACANMNANVTVLTSPNGNSNWTIRASETNNGSALAFAPSLSLLACGGTSSPTNGKICTNRDFLMRDLFFP